jgi:anti-sigma factor RsiW
MSLPCRESDLDALLAGELSAEEAGRVGAHAATCDTCARTLEWLRMERGWMARRAKRQPARRALETGAWEARLRPAPARSWLREWRGGMWAAAALVSCVMLSLLPTARPKARPEEPWGDGLVSMARVEVCTDPGIEAVARMEARVGACLLASPTQPPW